MDSITIIGLGSIFVSGLTIAIGSIGPAIGEGLALARALAAIAQQPDEAGTIYCFVVAIILIFANPFWNYVISKAGG